MIKKSILSILSFICFANFSIAQADRWQQHIDYKIKAALDVTNNIVKGNEELVYTNNSPDTLRKVYFHMYWNAFAPNSSMDIRSRELGKNLLNFKRGAISAANATMLGQESVQDWDRRVKDRIQKLSPTEIGYQRISQLLINGKAQKLIEHETILEVQLTQAITPKTSIKMNLQFEAQVPVQIRRSGRDNAEGVRYSMSQWYPKMVEYDYQGWNTNAYIAREFYGVWGNYDVTLTLDKSYVVAATGVLQNPNAIADKFGNLSWNFKGNNIHDFMWAADNHYKHLSKEVRKGLTFHVYFKDKDASSDSAWANVLWAAEKVLPYIEKKYGTYPYPQYSFIQGGDGGMEYGMGTLLKGPGIGTAIHEWMHSWYQHILGTNESLFPWMDEGFTSYAEDDISFWYNNNYALISPYINEKEKVRLKAEIENAKTQLPAIQFGNYAGYLTLAKSGIEEPMSTHSDHYNYNYSYSSSAYSKGATFLGLLGYVVSDSVRDVILTNYYNTWKFKHPNANDFTRVAEKTSGLQLQWLKEYWVNSTKTIDYGLNNIEVSANNANAIISIQRNGKFPMPIEVLVTYKDGTSELHYIPLDLMLGTKPAEGSVNRILHTEWQWVAPNYTFETSKPLSALKSIEIDPSQRMPDINRSNNKLEIPN
ncbi:MAG: M1 family peptidase [Chitinophagia bacterium]|nr:M1 family peptidase [Chitinophagia bacterium]NCA29400.1 M1 family peptidase [Chitinophagia bacterium]